MPTPSETWTPDPLSERLGRIEGQLERHGRIEVILENHTERLGRIEATLQGHDRRFDSVERYMLWGFGVTWTLVIAAASMAVRYASP